MDTLAHGTTALPRPAVIPARAFPPAGPALAVSVIALVAVYLNATLTWRQAALFLVGAAAGLVLYHAAFGFTSAWRVFISDRRGAGLRAQMLMLAVTCAVFFPLLGAGSLLGQPLRGSVSPAGLSVVAGAFLFGIGMQLGGGCASGTLYSAGGGSVRMLVVLAAFVAGSVIGTAHAPWWGTLPSVPGVSIVRLWGPGLALAASLVVFAAIAASTLVMERRRHGPAADSAAAPTRWVRGPWPLAAGAIGLALVNIATLLLAGRPWGVTSAFALWGAKIAQALGVPVDTWPYWTAPGPAAALRGSVLADATTVMNIGIVLGALLAALLAEKFAPAWRVPARSLAAAVVGGLLLGYGARAAYGCNIGAYFSGIASGSLHGWLWLPSAFAGSIVGTAMRPFFGLGVERSSRC